jgi:hypothetical protein
MFYDADRVQLNVIRADTDDLLDRITAYRAGMEPGAIVLVEEELRRREVTSEQIHAHEAWCRTNLIYHEDGAAVKCTFCYRPAVQERWGWYRLGFALPWLRRVVGGRGWSFGSKSMAVPLFPYHFHYCLDHGGVPAGRRSPEHEQRDSSLATAHGSEESIMSSPRSQAYQPPPG